MPLQRSDAVDLTDDIPGETAEFAILKPGTDKAIGWIVTLAGPSHAKTLAYKASAQRERLEKEARVEASQVNGRKFKQEVRTADEDNARTIAWLVSRIVTWSPVKIGDEVIEFSDDAATKLFSRPVMAPYIAQIVEYLQGERAFMKTSAIS